MTSWNPSVKRDLLTVNDWIRFGATQLQKANVFFGHGTDNAWDEAAQLVLWVIETPWQRLEQVVQTRLTDAEKDQVIACFSERIEKRLPAPYITGTAYFYELPFEVNQKVLIPRSPIAEMLEKQFAPWVSEPPFNILDLCTGSGCIGIACAYVFEQAAVCLSDVSQEAVTCAERNVRHHGLSERVQVVTSDLFEHVPERFDLIVSNPPYVDAEDFTSMPPEFHHEPSLALTSGADGLDFTRRLLAEAADHLNENGLLIGEVGNSWLALEAAFPDVPFTWVELERGGHGVFLLTRAQLVEHFKA